VAEAIANGDMPPFQTEVMGFWYSKFRPTQMGVNFTNIPRTDATKAEDINPRDAIEGRKQAAILRRKCSASTCRGARRRDHDRHARE